MEKRKWVAYLEEKNFQVSDLSKSIRNLIEEFNKGEDKLLELQNALNGNTLSEEDRKKVEIFLNGNGIVGDENETGLIYDLNDMDENTILKKIEKYLPKKEEFKQRAIELRKNNPKFKNRPGSVDNTKPKYTDPGGQNANQPDQLHIDPNAVLGVVDNDVNNPTPPSDPDPQQPSATIDGNPVQIVEEPVIEKKKLSTGASVAIAVVSIALGIFGLSQLAKKINK